MKIGNACYINTKRDILYLIVDIKDNIITILDLKTQTTKKVNATEVIEIIEN